MKEGGNFPDKPFLTRLTKMRKDLALIYENTEEDDSNSSSKDIEDLNDDKDNSS